MGITQLLADEEGTTVVELLRKVAANFPAEDRGLVIKVLEDEQAFNYRLRAHGFVLDAQDFHEIWSSDNTELWNTQLCQWPTQPAMCVIGAVTAARLGLHATGGEVVTAAAHYTEEHQLDTDILDDLIGANEVGMLIEALRQLEVE